ncbi:MAG: hypothetical protein J6M92_03555 [Oribacterium sp.]|nr:hypothetical protein [Oribacterium sp.]
MILELMKIVTGRNVKAAEITPLNGRKRQVRGIYHQMQKKAKMALQTGKRMNIMP